MSLTIIFAISKPYNVINVGIHLGCAPSNMEKEEKEERKVVVLSLFSSCTWYLIVHQTTQE